MPHQVVAVGPAIDPVPLLPGEAVIFSVHPSLVPLIFLITFVLVLGLGIGYLFFIADLASIIGFPQFRVEIALIPVAVAAIIAFIIFLNWLNTIYTLTDLRVQWQFGILGERTRNIANADIQAVQVDQGLIGRIFGYGDVSIRSAQQPIPIDFTQISDPETRAEQIQEEAI